MTFKFEKKQGGAPWKWRMARLAGIAFTMLAPMRVGAAAPLFIPSPGSPIAVGNRPLGVATGDFNGDGKQDIAVAISQFSQIHVLLGDGNGAFAAAPGSPFSSNGATPAGIVAKDFNKDGKTDLAVVYIGAGTVRVFLGDGHGVFTAAPAGATSVGSPGGYIASADFNGDGVPDITVTDNGGSKVIVLLSDGSGGFTSGTGSPFSTGFFNHPTGIAAGDFNKDGKADIVAVSSDDGGLTILLGNGAGGFTPLGFNPSVGPNPGVVHVTALTTANFYSSTTPDLIAAASSINQVYVLQGSGSGSFSYQKQLLAYQYPNALIAADFDGDGKLDLAAATGGTSYVVVFPGTGPGNFNTSTGPSFSTGSGPTSMATADFDGDGRSDLVTSNNNDNTLTVLLTNGPKLTVTPVTSAPAATPVPQTISFTVSDHLGSDQPFTLTATASSELPVSFKVLSGPATVTGNTLTLTGLGTVTVEAFQEGNYAFLPALSDRSFTVALGLPTIRSVVNGASFIAGNVPSNFYATILGNNLAGAAATGDASSTQILGGTNVVIVDSAKRSVTTTVWSVSFGQVNFVVPGDLAPGPATVTLTNSTGKSASSQITVGPIAPGLFSVDGTGTGWAQACTLTIGEDSIPVVQLSAVQTPFGPIPISITLSAGTKVYLILSGTGIRGRSSLAGVSLTVGSVTVPLTFAGAQGGFPALDQVAALLPLSLAGAGTVKAQLTVDGVSANPVALKFQ